MDSLSDAADHLPTTISERANLQQFHLEAQQRPLQKTVFVFNHHRPLHQIYK